MISIISASQAEGGKVVDYAKSYLKTIDEVIARGPYADTWESLGAYQIPEWFKRGKFGIFIHWGVYSVPAFGNSGIPATCMCRVRGRPRHHRKWGSTPSSATRISFRFLRRRTLIRRSGRAIRAGGAKYVVPVAEHHVFSDVPQWLSRYLPTKWVRGGTCWENCPRPFKRGGLFPGIFHRAATGGSLDRVSSLTAM